MKAERTTHGLVVSSIALYELCIQFSYPSPHHSCRPVHLPKVWESSFAHIACSFTDEMKREFSLCHQLHWVSLQPLVGLISLILHTGDFEHTAIGYVACIHHNTITYTALRSNMHCIALFGAVMRLPNIFYKYYTHVLPLV